MGTTTLLRYIPKWTNAPASSPRPSDLKDPITGVLPRRVSQVGTRAGDLGGVVAMVQWNLIQPTAGAPIDTSGTMDGSWREITDAFATGLPIRLRVLTGIYAPDDVKALNSGPLWIIDTDTGNGTTLYTIPKWWLPESIAAWADLMSKLAALLETNPQIREVASSPAATVYAEPCQRGTKPTKATTGPNAGKTNAQVFYEAGLAGVTLAANGKPNGPDPLDAASILWPTVREANGNTRWYNLGWKTTRHYLPFNPLQSWWVTGTSPFTYNQITDVASWTESAVGAVAGSMRNRVVLANNSLRVPLAQAGVKYPNMYAAEASQESANGFQTASLSRLLAAYQTAVPGATQAAALAACLDVGFGVVTSAADPNGLVSSPVTSLRARSIELPDGWASSLSSGQCAAWNNVAASNPIGD